MSTFLFMGFGSLILLTYLFLYTQYWWISFSYFTYFLADRTVCNRGGKRWNFVREARIWVHFANFFPAKIIKTCDYDTKKNYIFGYHPHGILSAGAMAHFATEGTGFSKLFPGLTPHLLVLQRMIMLPFVRDFFMCSGAVNASKESMNYLLGNDRVK
ncbi:UNVERIFIED_CONTAM: hypothetical protein GTU68_020301, partial [Idotea baltica]|nr:hypothetical protein [Idotea baltica]